MESKILKSNMKFSKNTLSGMCMKLFIHMCLTNSVFGYNQIIAKDTIKLAMFPK